MEYSDYQKHLSELKFNLSVSELKVTIKFVTSSIINVLNFTILLFFIIKRKK